MSLPGNFDAPTACLLAAAMSLLSAVVVSVLRSLHRRSRTAALLLAGALTANGLHLLLAAERGPDSSAWAIWAALLLAACSALALLESTRRLYGASSAWRRGLLTLFCYGAALALSPNTQAILLLHYGFQAATALAAVAVIVRAQDDQAQTARWGLASLFVGAATAAAVHGFEALYFNDFVLLSPTLRLDTSPRLLLVAEVMAPIAVMVLVLMVLVSRMLAEHAVADSTDQLTGLASRRFLLASAAQWRRSLAEQEAACALLMIDIDRFCRVNVDFGRDVGDAVLKHVAKTLNTNLRSDAILARYGGEEFCALVPIDRPAEAEAAAERLRNAIERTPYKNGLTHINVTVSIGVVMHGSRDDLQNLIEVAERRVSKAKQMGRNRVLAEDINSDLAFA